MDNAKNTLNMTIPITRKVLLLLNVLYWTVTFTLLCLPLYRFFSIYDAVDWSHFAYNLGSVMAVFYALAYFTNQWLNGLSLAAFGRLHLLGKFFYLFNKQILKILVVIAAYMVIALVLDNEFFLVGPDFKPYKDMPIQIERRLSRVYSFITNGPFYALALFLIRKLNNHNRVLESENKDLHKSFYQIGDLYETLKEETAKN
jgi:hypothetical protein